MDDQRPDGLDPEVFSSKELEDLDSWEYEFADEDTSEDPEFEGLPDLSDLVPPPPPEQEQDIIEEGMGAPGEAPKTPRQACHMCGSYITSNRPISTGYCLRYTRGWYQVGGLYVSAKEAFQGIPRQNRHVIRDWSKVPRGVIVYWPAHQYGHVALSLGNGFVGSTDWPAYRVGKVNGGVLTTPWNYPRAFWSPYINDVRVWKATKPRKPKPAPPAPPPQTKPGRDVKDLTRGERVDEMIRLGAIVRRNARVNGLERRAALVDHAIKDLQKLVQI